MKKLMSKASSTLSVAPSAAGKSSKPIAAEEEEKREEGNPDRTDHVSIAIGGVSPDASPNRVDQYNNTADRADYNRDRDNSSIIP